MVRVAGAVRGRLAARRPGRWPPHHRKYVAADAPQGAPQGPKRPRVSFLFAQSTLILNDFGLS
jgi:hypothetical protein